MSVGKFNFTSGNMRALCAHHDCAGRPSPSPRDKEGGED